MLQHPYMPAQQYNLSALLCAATCTVRVWDGVIAQRLYLQVCRVVFLFLCRQGGSSPLPLEAC